MSGTAVQRLAFGALIILMFGICTGWVGGL